MRANRQSRLSRWGRIAAIYLGLTNEKWENEFEPDVESDWHAERERRTEPTIAQLTPVASHLHPSLAVRFVLDRALAAPNQYHCAAVLSFLLSGAAALGVVITGSMIPYIGAGLTLGATLWSVYRARVSSKRSQALDFVTRRLLAHLEGQSQVHDSDVTLLGEAVTSLMGTAVVSSASTVNKAAMLMERVEIGRRALAPGMQSVSVSRGPQHG